MSQDVSHWVVTATAIVAIYGAVLSTISFVATRREKKRKVRVRLSYCFPTYGAEVGPNSLMVEAANSGFRSVSLVACGIILPNKNHIIFPSGEGHELPYDLEQGKHCIRIVPAADIAQEMKRVGLVGAVKVAGYFRDALGTTYKSQRFRFNVDTALRG